MTIVEKIICEARIGRTDKFISALSQFATDVNGMFVFGSKGEVELQPTSNDTILLNGIISKEPGGGNFVLKTLTSLADKQKIKLELKPYPFNPDRFSQQIQKKLDIEQLVAWYKRNGFEFSQNNYMIRNPKQIK